MTDEDGTIEAIAKALYETAVHNALEDISRLSVDLNIVADTYAHAQLETDRSCAITIFALIDQIICDLFFLHLNALYAQGRRRLFAEFGILPTASRRIEMLFALGWINQDTYHDLNLLRKIRNAFAHQASIQSFRMNPIKGYMSSFEVDSGHIERACQVMDGAGISVNPVNILEKKEKNYFLLVSNIILRKAAMEILVTPITIKHGLDRRSILGTFPEEDGVLRHVHRTFAATAVGILEFIGKSKDFALP